MEIAKKLQLTPKEFEGLQGTELYATMMQNCYQVSFENLDSAIANLEVIGAHCKSVWYLDTSPVNGVVYNIYFSSVVDASIMGVEDEKR